MFRGANLISTGGLAFVYISGLTFIITAYRLFRNIDREPTMVGYYPELILCGIAVFTAILGVSLLRAAGVASIVPGPVIDPAEWKTLSREIKEGKEDAITQYVRLRSLTGFTGVFTKLGLQGLPLATIGLTLFFSLMYLRDQAYIELAKLTLGAFIGSFVQKQVGERQGGGGTVQLPTGEKVKVSTAPPAPMA